MANLSGLLGTLLATGMAGRSRRGPAFGSQPFDMLSRGAAGGTPRAGLTGSGIGKAAGLASLGFLAYKAYQDYQRNNPSSLQPGRSDGMSGETGVTRPQARESGQSLGDRLAGMLKPDQQAQPEAALGDEKALLLIRAMVAAAAADSHISADERERILSRIDEAGASPEDRRLLENELAAPWPIDALVQQVRDQETAEQVYLASAMAIEPDTPAERTYLQDLAARLSLDPQRAQSMLGMS